MGIGIQWSVRGNLSFKIAAIALMAFRLSRIPNTVFSLTPHTSPLRKPGCRTPPARLAGLAARLRARLVAHSPSPALDVAAFLVRPSARRLASPDFAHAMTACRSHSPRRLARVPRCTSTPPFRAHDARPAPHRRPCHSSLPVTSPAVRGRASPKVSERLGRQPLRFLFGPRLVWVRCSSPARPRPFPAPRRTPSPPALAALGAAHPAQLVLTQPPPWPFTAISAAIAMHFVLALAAIAGLTATNTAATASANVASKRWNRATSHPNTAATASASTFQIRAPSHHSRASSTQSVVQLEQRLIELEERFGGLATQVPCSHLQPLIGGPDPVQCVGGDRMKAEWPSHNYAPTYAKVLHKLNQRLEVRAVAEIGVLKATGLALWSQLYPNATIHGFDLSLENAFKNLRFLYSRGAFSTDKLRLHEFSQLAPGTVAAHIGALFDVVIDDALHTEGASNTTWQTFEKLVRPGGVYIIEDCDCPELRRHIQGLPHYKVDFFRTSKSREASYMIVAEKLRQSI